MKVAIFDFDGTLFPIDTLRFLLSCWKKNKYSKFKYYKTYFLLMSMYMVYKIKIKFKIPNQTMRNKALQSFNYIFKGMNEDEVVDYLNNCAEGIIKQLNPKVVDEVRKAKSEGYYLVLLSGTYELLLYKVAEYLEIDTVIGTKMYFNNGQFDQYKKLDIISGPKKLEYFNKYFKDTKIDLALSLAFADSFTDIEILKAVGQAIAVNPDNKLREIANESNWRIIS